VIEGGFRRSGIVLLSVWLLSGVVIGANRQILEPGLACRPSRQLTGGHRQAEHWRLAYG
jgi:hypothetical protein